MDEEVEAAMMRAGAQIEALQREIDALRKDAERYRWLRDSLLVGDDWQALADMPEPENADEFDASIDAVMQGANA